MNIEPVYHLNLVYVKSKVPSFVLEELKQEAKNILENPNQYEEWNKKLAGNLEKEYKTSKSREILQPYLISLADEYFKDSEHHGKCPHWEVDNLWINFQKKYEYNPLHNHTGDLSFVLWIQIPYKLEDEFSHSNCINSNTPTNSLFQFTYTNLRGELVQDKLEVDKSYEGTIVMFPSTMYHMVYPFYTSDKYRISISGNIYSSVTKNTSSYEYR